MIKIQINLNPRQVKSENKFIQTITRLLFPLTVFAFILLVVILTVSLSVFLKAANYRQYAQAWEEWKNKGEAIQVIKSDIASLEKEKKEIQRVTAKSVDVSALCKELSAAVPKNIWLNTFEFKEHRLVLAGCVVKWNEDYLVSLDTLIRALREKRYLVSQFKDIDIRKSQKSQFYGVDVLNFTIECTN